MTARAEQRPDVVELAIDAWPAVNGVEGAGAAGEVVDPRPPPDGSARHAAFGRNRFADAVVRSSGCGTFSARSVRAAARSSSLSPARTAPRSVLPARAIRSALTCSEVSSSSRRDQASAGETSIVCSQDPRTSSRAPPGALNRASARPLRAGRAMNLTLRMLLGARDGTTTSARRGTWVDKRSRFAAYSPVRARVHGRAHRSGEGSCQAETWRRAGTRPAGRDATRRPRPAQPVGACSCTTNLRCPAVARSGRESARCADPRFDAGLTAAAERSMV